MQPISSKLRLAIIGTAGVPGRYGGFETLAHQLVGHLGTEFDLTVFCSKKMYSPAERAKPFQGAKRIFLPLHANGVQSILYDIISMLYALFIADYLLVFGVSGCIALPLIRLISRKKIIVNIDGLEWKRDKWPWIGRKFLEISEYFAVRFAHADITDNAALRDYTAKRYGSQSRLIEYGGDHAAKVKCKPGDPQQFPFLASPYAFSVCRIEPENNIHLLLEAFAKLGPRQLAIVGNWENSEYGERLKDQYGHFAHIHLLDPIYDPQKLNLLRSNCYIYLHGHSAGGTNPSLVEAMCLGLPVLAYDVIFNRETTESCARFFATSKELVDQICQLEPLDYFELGEEMQAIAGRRYTWAKISAAYQSLIQALENGFLRPNAVSDLARLDSSILAHYELCHMSYLKN